MTFSIVPRFLVGHFFWGAVKIVSHMEVESLPFCFSLSLSLVISYIWGIQILHSLILLFKPGAHLLTFSLGSGCTGVTLKGIVLKGPDEEERNMLSYLPSWACACGNALGAFRELNK